MYFAHVSNFLSAVARLLSVCFAVAVCCRLNREPIRLCWHHQQLRNHLTTCPISPNIIRRWDRARVKRFVIAAHLNFAAVKAMLAEEPKLTNGTIDWGNGDFETALGGASHMGRRDIAEYLLEHNARMDIFAATMLGKLDIVKAAVTSFPSIVHVPGPHGIPLIVHAEKGGPAANDVLEFLRPLAGQPVPLR